MKNNLIDNIKEHWQILATTLIGWSLFDLYNFYKPFGIDIVSYLTIGETVLLVFPSLITGVITTILIISLLIFLVDSRDAESSNTQKNNTSLFEFRSSFRLLRDHYKPLSAKNAGFVILGIVGLVMNLGMICLMVGMAYNIFMLFVSEQLIIYTQSKIGILFFLDMLFVIPVIILLDNYFEKRPNLFLNFTLRKRPLLYLISILALNSVVSNRITYLQIIHGENNRAVHFVYKDRNYKTDSSLVYIGASQSYIFLRNNLDSSNSIFRKEELSDFVLKKLPK